MVFRVFLASILILGQARSMAQIEKLTTEDEVVNFVRKVAPEYGSISSKFGFRRITHASFDSLVKIYHLKSFEKADLDGNGLTDLIFNGSEYSYSESDSIARPISLAILSFGKDSLCVRDLSLENFEDVAAHLLWLDGKPYIQTFHAKLRMIDTEYHAEYHIDTLAWKFNVFIEKKAPIKRKITQIDYNAWNGLAFWTDITLRIIGDSARLTKERNDDLHGIDRGGVFLTRLDPNTSQRLYGLLGAMDFASLKDSFHIEAFDATTGNIKITYDDGQTKIIMDYGICGTYGLAEFHRLLYGLTATQHWVNADPVSPRCIDSLHSDRDVLGLIRTLEMDYPFLEFEPDTPVNPRSDYRKRLIAFGEQRWQKGDIDGNGHTDLLFNGYLNKDGQSDQYSIVVLSFGGDSLRQQVISWENSFFAARIIRYNSHDEIQIRYLDAREDTLTADDGQIVELPAASLHHIEALNVHEEIGSDSIVVMRHAIYWYRNDAAPPDFTGASVSFHKDSINLYKLADAKAAQKLFSIAAGIRFERLNPNLLHSNGITPGSSSTWNITQDGRKQSRLTSDDPIGYYRLHAMEDYLWELKRNRNNWKLASKN